MSSWPPPARPRSACTAVAQRGERGDDHPDAGAVAELGDRGVDGQRRDGHQVRLQQQRRHRQGPDAGAARRAARQRVDRWRQVPQQPDPDRRLPGRHGHDHRHRAADCLPVQPLGSSSISWRRRHAGDLAGLQVLVQTPTRTRAFSRWARRPPSPCGRPTPVSTSRSRICRTPTSSACSGCSRFATRADLGLRDRQHVRQPAVPVELPEHAGEGDGQQRLLRRAQAAARPPH